MARHLALVSLPHPEPEPVPEPVPPQAPVVRPRVLRIAFPAALPPRSPDATGPESVQLALPIFSAEVPAPRDMRRDRKRVGSPLTDPVYQRRNAGRPHR